MNPMLLIATSLLLGACADINPPKVVDVTVVTDGVAGTVIDVSYISETTIHEDVPADATLRLTFDEPVQLSSVASRVRLFDDGEDPFELALSQRLDAIDVSAIDGFGQGNHILEVDNGIEDASGNPTIQSYDIVFFVP